MPDEEQKEQDLNKNEEQKEQHEEKKEDGQQKEAGEEKDKEKEEEKKTIPWYQDHGFTFKDEKEAVKSMKELRGHATRSSQEASSVKRINDIYGKFIGGELELEDGQTIEQYIAKDQKSFEEEEKKRNEKLEEDTKTLEQMVRIGKRLYPKIVTDENMDILNALAYKSDKFTPLERMEDAVVMFEERFGHLNKEEKQTIEDEKEKMKREAEMETPGGKVKGKKDVESAWDLSPEEFRKSIEDTTYKQ